MNKNGGMRRKPHGNLPKKWIPLLALAALLTPLATRAGTYGDLTYTSDGSSITITDCATTATNVVVPDTIESFPVTDIGYKAFFGCTSLTNVALGSGITNIGFLAFQFCENMATISVDPGNAYYSSQAGILYANNQKTIVFYPAGRTGSYSIAGTVTNLADGAFMSTSLTNVLVPDSVSGIGDWVFQHSTNLTDIAVDAANPYFSSTNGILFNKDQTTVIQYPAGKTNSNYAIPDGVAKIGNGAFTKSYHLLNIMMPNTVTNIGQWVFESSHIAAVTIPDSVQTLDDFAFAGCANITNIVIGQSVTNIGRGTFMNCSSLTRLTIPDSATAIGYIAFNNCTSLTNVVFGNSVVSIGEYAFTGCSLLSRVFFTGSTPTVEIYSFTDAIQATVYYLPGTSGWGATFGGRPTVLWNPVMQLGLGYGATTNGFSFNISGTSEIPIAVVACTNLAEGNWIPLQSTNLTGGSLDFTDPDWTNYPSRIYRITAP